MRAELYGCQGNYEQGVSFEQRLLQTQRFFQLKYSILPKHSDSRQCIRSGGGKRVLQMMNPLLVVLGRRRGKEILCCKHVSVIVGTRLLARWESRSPMDGHFSEKINMKSVYRGFC